MLGDGTGLTLTTINSWLADVIATSSLDVASGKETHEKWQKSSSPASFHQWKPVAATTKV